MNLEEREQTQNEQKEADRIRLSELEALSKKQQEEIAFINTSCRTPNTRRSNIFNGQNRPSMNWTCWN